MVVEESVSCEHVVVEALVQFDQLLYFKEVAYFLVGGQGDLRLSQPLQVFSDHYHRLHQDLGLLERKLHTVGLRDHVVQLQRVLLELFIIEGLEVLLSFLPESFVGELEPDVLDVTENVLRDGVFVAALQDMVY